MSNAARQKRTAEASSRYSNSKKPRFDYRNPSTLAPDAPEEDTILDLDEIGKSGLKTKRNAINLDGFDSDSSAEDATTLRNTSVNGKATASKDEDGEEEVDMFAEADDDPATTGGPTNGSDSKNRDKAVRFIEMDQIEGQDLRSKSGGHVSSDLLLKQRHQDQDKGKGPAPPHGTQDQEQRGEESSSEESVADEERAALNGLLVDDAEDAQELGAGSKKKHAPRLDAFNMQAEADEGRFDDSGNFVRKAVDPDAVHDSWLDGLSRKDMKRAAEAQEKRDAEQRRRNAEDDALLTADLLAALIGHLEPGETVLEALARLGKGRRNDRRKGKAVPRWKQKKTSAAAVAAAAVSANGHLSVEQMDVDEIAERKGMGEAGEAEEGGGGDPAEKKRREAVEAITAAADKLFSTRDQQDIYEQEREMLMRQYRRETGEDWKGRTGLSTEERASELAAITTTATATATTNTTTDTTTNGSSRQQWEYMWTDGRDGGLVNGPYDGPTMAAWKDAGYFDDGPQYRMVGDTRWHSVVDFV